ncbi:MAG: arsenate reductase (glutaredoxin) [Planctomycetota bacterium]
MSGSPTVTVWFNPRCSKCRQARDLLEERGIAAEYRLYLENPPSREEAQKLQALLGLSDPAGMMRAKESAWKELGLEKAGPAARLEALLQHPVLLERPIVAAGGRAVVARPPEKLLDLFEDRSGSCAS